MKYGKRLGLAVVAALAVMALAGPTSASATQVCVSGSGDGKCPWAAGERELESGGSFTATATNPVFTTTVTNVTCEKSSMTLKAEGNTQEPIVGEITALSFSGKCKTASGTECTVTTTNAPHPFSLSWAFLSITDVTGIAADVKCGFLINCTFSSQAMTLGVSPWAGGTEFEAASETLTRSGGFCPQDAALDASYLASGTTVI